MIHPKCIRKTKVEKIKIEERGRKAIFLNPHREEYSAVQVDGCVVTNELAADWVVSKCKVGDVIVELKGKDVEHATKQVVATAKLWKQKGLCQGKLAGLIVCSQYPKASTSVQKKQQAFASEFSGQLHVRTRNREYDLEQLLGG